MSSIQHVSLIIVSLAAFGCASPDESIEVTAETEEAFIGDNTCVRIKGHAHPNSITHIHDATLQQFVGRTRMTRGGWRLGLGKRRGAFLGTVVGQNPDGSLLANHHISFDGGVVRTENDNVVLTPTADACVLDLSADLFFVDGTGAFEGRSGTGRAYGTFDVCTNAIDLSYRAELCR